MKKILGDPQTSKKKCFKNVYLAKLKGLKLNIKTLNTIFTYMKIQTENLPNTTSFR